MCQIAELTENGGARTNLKETKRSQMFTKDEDEY